MRFVACGPQAVVVAAVLGAFNFLCITFFFGERWGYHLLHGSYRREKLALAAYVGVIGLAILLGGVVAKWRPPVLLFQFSQTVGIVCLLSIEILFYASPSLLPQKVLKVAPQLDRSYEDMRSNTLELLPESPYVKFRPNTLVRVVDYRGTDFTYTWTTDALGFKNDSKISALSNVDVIAIGDSFVEGMGVAASDTWTSLVTQNGYPAYNLGVQGYAPQQIAGVLKRFASRFKTKIVLFGYTPGFEDRTLHFTGTSGASREAFTGGIESINSYLKEVRREGQMRFRLLDTLLNIFRRNVHDLFSGGHNDCYAAQSDSGARFSRYCGETKAGLEARFDPEDQKWKLTTGAILDARNAAGKQGSRFALVVFHQRPLVYFPQVMGRAAPDNHFELMTGRALRSFADSNGIDIIDTYSALSKYMADLGDADLPYFALDGHMNETGQRIVAKTVEQYLREHKF